MQRIVVAAGAFLLVLPLWFALAPYPAQFSGRCSGAVWEVAGPPNQRCFDAPDRLRTAAVLAAGIAAATALAVFLVSDRDADREEPE